MKLADQAVWIILGGELADDPCVQDIRSSQRAFEELARRAESPWAREVCDREVARLEAAAYAYALEIVQRRWSGWYREAAEQRAAGRALPQSWPGGNCSAVC